MIEEKLSTNFFFLECSTPTILQVVKYIDMKRYLETRD